MIKSQSIKKRIASFPSAPGVYFFKGEKGQMLYIGRATNLKSRVRSYFSGHDSRGERIDSMVEQSQKIGFQKTESVLEAVVLEANLIKKNQPKYNVDLRDDKTFAYIVVTDETFPRFVTAHQTQLAKFKAKRIYGPYTSKSQAETVLKILRRIFPYHSSSQHTEKGCLYSQIGLCPGPYDNTIAKAQYQKNIRNIEYVLRGQRKRLIVTLKKEMEKAANAHNYEHAAQKRNQIFAIEHIRDSALLKKDEKPTEKADTRIEGYDISNISGQYAVGSMVVFVGGKPVKSEYRKFKIRAVKGIDDVAMMREVLARRFRHSEWPQPSLAVLDGGKGHLNMAQHLIKKLGLDVPLAAVAKGPTRKKVDVYVGKDPLPDPQLTGDKELLEQVREEAHRFAISYHRNLRKRGFVR